MSEYLCKFSVNGNRTEQIVKCNGSYDAKRIIEAQYPGAKISWSCTPSRIN